MAFGRVENVNRLVTQVRTWALYDAWATESEDVLPASSTLGPVSIGRVVKCCPTSDLEERSYWNGWPSPVKRWDRQFHQGCRKAAFPRRRQAESA